MPCQAAEPEFICYPLYCTKPNQSRNKTRKIIHLIFISSFLTMFPEQTNTFSGELKISKLLLTESSNCHILKRTPEC
jgi:hypothetical protein